MVFENIHIIHFEKGVKSESVRKKIAWFEF